MTNYFLSTLSILTVLSLFELIIPKSSSGKAVKIVISLISTLVLLPPILSILKLENFNKENAFLNVSLDSYLESLEENAVISKVEFALDSGNFEYECVEIEYGYDNEQKYISKIVIIFSSEVIIDESERINMIKEAKKLLSNVVDTQKVGVELETD